MKGSKKGRSASQRAMDRILGRYKEWLGYLLSSPRLPFVRHVFPEESAVYRIAEKGAKWRSSLYVGKAGKGKASNLRYRIITGHLMGNINTSPIKRKLIQAGRFKSEEAVKRYLRQRCFVQYVPIEDERFRVL